VLVEALERVVAALATRRPIEKLGATSAWDVIPSPLSSHDGDEDAAVLLSAAF